MEDVIKGMTDSHQSQMVIGQITFGSVFLDPLDHQLVTGKGWLAVGFFKGSLEFDRAGFFLEVGLEVFVDFEDAVQIVFTVVINFVQLELHPF